MYIRKKGKRVFQNMFIVIFNTCTCTYYTKYLNISTLPIQILKVLLLNESLL